jgi:hypothetical protein
MSRKQKHKLVTFGEIAHRAFSKGAPREKSVDGEKHPVKIRTIPVMWGIPCDELGFSKFWRRFVTTANYMPWDSFAISEGTYLEKARNRIHNNFLTSNLPYLMMLDSDILFPPDTLERLLVHKLPMVGGWYKDKNAEDHHPVIYDFIEDKDGMAIFRHRKEPGTGLERVGGMGAGCWLMSREVAQALGEDPYGHNIAGGGEDMKLCRRLLELNIPLYVDWTINCAHVGVGFV